MKFKLILILLLCGSFFATAQDADDTELSLGRTAGGTTDTSTKELLKELQTRIEEDDLTDDEIEVTLEKRKWSFGLSSFSGFGKKSFDSVKVTGKRKSIPFSLRLGVGNGYFGSLGAAWHPTSKFAIEIVSGLGLVYGLDYYNGGEWSDIGVAGSVRFHAILPLGSLLLFGGPCISGSPWAGLPAIGLNAGIGMPLGQKMEFFFENGLHYTLDSSLPLAYKLGVGFRVKLFS